MLLDGVHLAEMGDLLIISMSCVLRLDAAHQGHVHQSAETNSNNSNSRETIQIKSSSCRGRQA